MKVPEVLGKGAQSRRDCVLSAEMLIGPRESPPS